MTYFLTFRARGEVAEMLLLGGEEPRLLVDLSTEPLADDMGPRRHTPRASFTITDPELIRRFLNEIKPGDIAEAEGAFQQGDYVPHRTTCIDTVFTIVNFKRIARRRTARRNRTIATPEPLSAESMACEPISRDAINAARAAAPMLLH